MVQRYHADKISTHPEGAITLYSDYAALEQRCGELEGMVVELIDRELTVAAENAELRKKINNGA